LFEFFLSCHFHFLPDKIWVRVIAFPVTLATMTTLIGRRFSSTSTTSCVQRRRRSTQTEYWFAILCKEMGSNSGTSTRNFWRTPTSSRLLSRKTDWRSSTYLPTSGQRKPFALRWTRMGTL